MERITPNEPTPGLTKTFTEDDPFGDSFTNVVPSVSHKIYTKNNITTN